MEKYKSNLKFTHIVDVDKILAQKIREIRLQTRNFSTKEFKMRTYVDSKTNKMFPSVTTVLQKDSEGLRGWFKFMKERYGGEGASNFEGERTRNRGTRLHKYLQDTMNNLEIAFQDTLSKGLYKQLYPYLKKIGNIYCVEKELCSHELKIAGRVDLIAMYNGKLTVIDFKSSNKDRTKDDWYAPERYTQAWTYAHCLEELTGIKVPQVVILVSSEDLTVNEFISTGDEKTQYIENMKSFIQDFNKENNNIIKEVLNDEEYKTYTS